MLQWAKTKTVREKRQVVPCSAGRMTAVVYSNGDVSACEMHKPVANIRQKSFPEIWASEDFRHLRESIGRKECYCTTEVFLWPSIVYQPPSLVRGMLGGKVWMKPVPLTSGQKIHIQTDDQKMPVAGG
jgi:hypothetical protein